MNSESNIEQVKAEIINKIEALSEMGLRHFYTENIGASTKGELQIEAKCILSFKEIGSNVSLKISFTNSLTHISAHVSKSDVSNTYVFFDSYLKNQGKDSALQQTKHWDGHQWITNFDKYLDLVSELATQEFKPVLKGDEWISDQIDLDNFVTGKK